MSVTRDLGGYVARHYTATQEVTGSNNPFNCNNFLLLKSFLFSRNTKSRHCWHFCIISNKDKLKIVCSTFQNLSNVHWIKIGVADNNFLLILKFGQYKNANNGNFGCFKETLLNSVKIILGKLKWLNINRHRITKWDVQTGTSCTLSVGEWIAAMFIFTVSTSIINQYSKINKDYLWFR